MANKRVFSVVECIGCSHRVDRATAFRGMDGRYWCIEHTNRGKLLDWAQEHGYPAIVFTGKTIRHYPVQGLPDYIAPIKYRIGFESGKNSKDIWVTNAVCGSDDLISAAMNYAGIESLIANDCVTLNTSDGSESRENKDVHA